MHWRCELLGKKWHLQAANRHLALFPRRAFLTSGSRYAKAEALAAQSFSTMSRSCNTPNIYQYSSSESLPALRRRRNLALSSLEWNGMNKENGLHLSAKYDRCKLMP